MGRAIAFLGLGVMGAPMAGHLARAWHRVTVYNRTGDKAAAWVERHRAFDVALAATPAEAAAEQDAVLTCVGNDDDLAEVVLEAKGALAAMREGALLVDHTTVSPAIARRIAGAADHRGLRGAHRPRRRPGRRPGDQGR
jgi:3-hydroxyisobutyrate dehydrogenase